jgi:hypothetical protein
MADRRTILSLIGFRFRHGAWRFESISIADDAIDGLDEPAWQEGTARWWRREPSLPGREVVGDVPDYP